MKEDNRVARGALYGGLTKKEFENIENRIQSRNVATLTITSALASILLLLLLSASFLVDALEKNRVLYLVFFLGMLLIYIFTKVFLKKNEKYVFWTYYVFLAAAYLFAIILGVYLQTEVPATTFCVLMFALPLLIIDKPYRISLLLVVVSAVFCVATKGVKETGIASLDVVNAISFLFLGVAVNFFVMKTKISEIYGQMHIERERDTDDLTKLMTKAAAAREIEEFIEADKGKAALLVIDIDNFKNVNDSMGHAYGDAVLRIMGECIRKVFRESDVRARFGGDEFVIFLPMLGTQEIVTKRVNALVETMNGKLTLPEKAIKVTGSIGIAFYPDHAKSYEELFDKADKALYYSKGQGKNCYTFYFDPDIAKKS